ncbi:ABC transporter permease [Oerskovia paurometabola]|uniref:Transport permease protein n=1 Tax=Oerskovia paurometabola TaxID=162170 RepID=A0ABW1XGM6_9CELL|nr:ABC transporter permease [Oerskovia paurometabola]MBM7495350.1 ABC-2 type transport system permease protein [Oerskovia paurometabola]
MSTVDTTTTTGGGPAPTRPQPGSGSASGRPGARPRGRLANLGRDTWIVLVRELRPLLHDPFSVVFGLVQPLVFLALFGPLLVGTLSGQDGGATGTLGGSVWQWFVPSILVMTTLFGTSTTGANLQQELNTGAHERMLVSPLSRPSLLLGRALKEMVPIAAQSVVVVLVMLPFGFELFPVGAVLGLAMLAIFGVGVGSLSYALALAVRKQEWMFWLVQQTLLFPLMILSGMLLPLETGPSWMRAAAHLNPLTYLVDAERALFAGDLTSSAAAWGWVAALVTAAVGLAVGIRTMVRSTD